MKKMTTICLQRIVSVEETKEGEENLEERKSGVVDVRFRKRLFLSLCKMYVYPVLSTFLMKRIEKTRKELLIKTFRI